MSLRGIQLCLFHLEHCVCSVWSVEVNDKAPTDFNGIRIANLERKGSGM